jgi:hypothetical protein
MGVATQARWSLDTNLSVVSAVVHGLDVAASWRLSPTPGTFWLSYVVPPHAPLLVGVPPTVQLQLEDPRWVPGPLSLAPLPLFPNSDLGPWVHLLCAALDCLLDQVPRRVERLGGRAPGQPAVRGLLCWVRGGHGAACCGGDWLSQRVHRAAR